MNVYLLSSLGLLVGLSIGLAYKFRSYRESIKRRYKDEIALITFNKLREVNAVKESYEKIFTLHAEWVARLLNSRFSLSSRLTRFSVIIDLNGNAKICRYHVGLTSGKGVTLNYIDHKLVCPIQDSVRGEINLIKESCSEGVTMVPLEKESTNQTYAFRINLPAPEARPEEGVDYALSVSYRNAFLMSKEEAEDLYRGTPTPFENFYYEQEIPSKNLELQVEFPKGYEVVPFARVYLLGGWTLDSTQTARLEVVKKDNVVSVHVLNPLHGFRYMIGWTSPSAEEISKLKGGGNS